MSKDIRIPLTVHENFTVHLPHAPRPGISKAMTLPYVAQGAHAIMHSSSPHVQVSPPPHWPAGMAHPHAPPMVKNLPQPWPARDVYHARLVPTTVTHAGTPYPLSHPGARAIHPMVHHPIGHAPLHPMVTMHPMQH